MKVFTLLAVGAFVAHAWIGLWTVFTDYLTEYMLGPIGNIIRPLLQIAVVLALVVYAIWVVQVIWG
jgi:succinate dehydrogenase / fumarate reductase membrane anchor subunit